MQPGHIDLGYIRLLGFAKDACRTVQKLALPLRNLVGVDLKLLS